MSLNQLDFVAIIVIKRESFQTVTNFYIANLALADVILAMFCIPFQFRAALMQRWELPAFMCQFCPFIQILSVRQGVPWDNRGREVDLNLSKFTLPP